MKKNKKQKNSYYTDGKKQRCSRIVSGVRYAAYKQEHHKLTMSRVQHRGYMYLVDRVLFINSTDLTYLYILSSVSNLISFLVFYPNFSM